MNTKSGMSEARTLFTDELGEKELKQVTGGTGGAGAGKIRFNEFQIKKTSNQASPF
jgi:bacteriocin-like protein